MKQFYTDVQRQIKTLRSLFTEDSSILLLTHKGCLDGHGCQMLMEKNFNDVFTVKLSPADTDSYVQTLNTDDFDVIIFADLSTKDKVFLNKPNTVLVDHHATAAELHNPSNNIFVYQDECGTYLLQKFIECIKQKQNKKLDDLVNVINDYDMWRLCDDRSKPLQALFYHIGEDTFTDRFWNFKVKFNEEEINWWKETLAHRKLIFDNMDVFQAEGSKVGFVFQTEFSNEFCDDALNELDIDVIVFVKPRMGSVRTNRKDISVGKMLEDLGIGGGHDQAGGFRCQSDDAIRKCVEMIEDYSFKNF